MSGFSSPNHTQVPNDLFDVMLPLMGEAELKIVLFAVRQTLGYHRGSDAISLSQFMKGTGLSRQGVLDGIEAAKTRGVMREASRGKRGIVVYALVYSVDQSAQETSSSQDSRPVDAVTSQASRHTKEKKIKEKKIKHSAPKLYDDVPHKVRTEIIEAWSTNLVAAPANAYSNDNNHIAAANIARAGYTAGDTSRFVAATMKDPFWKGKTLTLTKVSELMPAWLANNRPKPKVQADGSGEAAPITINQFVRKAETNHVA